MSTISWVVAALAIIALGVATDRITVVKYPFYQGWFILPTIALVPKSIKVGGVQYVIISIMWLGIEVRWMAWRWNHAGPRS